MASILDAFSGAISAKLADIRAAVRTLQTELDDSGLASHFAVADSQALGQRSMLLLEVDNSGCS